MKLNYLYRCNKCRTPHERTRKVDERNKPFPCRMEGCFGRCHRVFTPPQFIANRQVDLPGNKYALGFSEKDRMEAMRLDDRMYEKKSANWDPTPMKTKSMDEILSTGVVDAYRSGPEALQRWKDEHAPKSDEPVNSYDN